VTGDQVIARRTGTGITVIDVKPGPGRDKMAFHKLAFGNQQLVVPLDAAPLVTAGVVDSKLFDVALLANLGLDDKSAPRLPLLVQYGAKGSANAVRSALPEGTQVKRTLPIVDAVAIGQERTQAGDLWSSWMNSTAAKRRTGLAGTVTKVMLDGGVTPMLDRSVPQIGAPAAWQAGLTGKGVKVAMLDTGYDATHPDLQGRVIATKGFTTSDDGTINENDVKDTVGHGTHTASTVAGTGAASDGKYRGVAPDADLMIGKVCASQNCEPSAILAGMEWAATSGARVINLSIGSGPTDGTDILSEAINKLTAETGALFVVSAGNFGLEGSVSAPSTADAALSVASVTKADGHSDFSSQGPRLIDLAVKPDISAPGSKIVAARAAGAPLDPYAVNASYAELSGTSMAAPHVSGAAALLAQAHPDWKAPQLKSALMGSALGLTGQGIYTQGAGRVDVEHALRQTVLALPGALNLGLQKAPHADDKPVTKPVTYVNDGASAVRLSLKLEGASVFRLSRASVTVPAHGSATVDVTATTSGPEAEGAYGAWLVASGNGQSIRSTVGVGKEVTTYPHTLQMLDRSGAVATNDETHVAGSYFLDVDRQQLYSVEADSDVNLPAGHYVVDGYEATFNPDGGGFKDVTYFSEPDLVISKAGPIVLDGRRAVKVATRPPVTGATAVTAGVGFVRPIGDRNYLSGVGVTNLTDPAYVPELYVVPNTTGSAKNFTAFADASWAGMADGQGTENEPFLNSPYYYHDAMTWPGRIPAKPSLITAARDYAHVAASYAGVDGISANNYSFPALATAGADGDHAPAFVFVPAVAMRLPFQRDEYYSTKGLVWSFTNELYRFTPEDGYDYFAVVESPSTAYKAGRTTKLNWQRGVFGPSLPDPRTGNPGRTPLPWVSRDGNSLSVYTPAFADGTPNNLGETRLASEQTTLYRNGEQIASTDALQLQTFALPPGEATYRLSKVIKRAADPAFTNLSTEIRSDYTFRSQQTPDGANAALPLLNVRYTPALDESNRAPRGTFTFPITVQTAFQAQPHPITALTLDASTDDGHTWTPVRVTRTSANTWTAHLNQPTAAYITLRTQTHDSAGNQLTQTITRAYEVK
jgi:subtilisin family serine protease